MEMAKKMETKIYGCCLGIWVAFSEVPISRTIQFSGLYCGPHICGNYQVHQAGASVSAD